MRGEIHSSLGNWNGIPAWFQLFADTSIKFHRVFGPTYAGVYSGVVWRMNGQTIFAERKWDRNR